MSQPYNQPKFEAQSYLEFRPAYPAEIFLDFVLLADRAGQRLDILDLGCGTGLATTSILNGTKIKSDSHFHLVDPDPSMLSIAKHELKASRVPTHFYLGSAEKIPLADQSVDMILVGSAFHWFKESAQDELKRVAKPKAHLQIFEYQFPRAQSKPELNLWVKKNFNEHWKAPEQTPRGKLKDILKPLSSDWQLLQHRAPPMIRSLDLDTFLGHLISQSRYQHFETGLSEPEIREYRLSLKKELEPWWHEGLISFDFYLQSFWLCRR
jgi:SAM-dependent methyltransferase